MNNLLLNGDNVVKGASAEYGFDTDSTLRAAAAFTSGMRNFNTNFQPFPTNAANWGTSGRVEWKLFGNWKDYTLKELVLHQSSMHALCGLQKHG